MKDLSTLVAIAAALGALFAGFITLTAPVIATGGPAVMTVALSALAFFAWRYARSPN